MQMKKIEKHFKNFIINSDTDEKIWAWIGEETPKFYYDNGKEIRFKGHKSMLTKFKDFNINLMQNEEKKNEYFFTVKKIPFLYFIYPLYF